MDVFGIFGALLYITMVGLWLITLAVPMRYAVPSIASCVMLAAICYEWPFGHHSQGLRYSSGTDATVMKLFELMAVTIAFKLLAVALMRAASWRAWKHYDSTAQPIPPAIRHKLVIPDIAMTGTGAIAGMCIVSTFAASALHLHPSWLAHALAIAPAVVLGTLTPLCERMLHLGRQARRFGAGLRWSVVATSVVAGAFIAWSIGRVVHQAEFAAQEAPYCIVVVDWRDAPWDRWDNRLFYLGDRPALTLLDLSPLTMRAPCTNDRCFANHAAIMISDPDTPTTRRLVWSYRRQDFLNDERDRRVGKPSCARPSFTRTLPLF